MGILNRRNAFVGWLTLLTAKRVLRRKAVERKRRLRKAALAVAAAVAAAVAGLWWFRRTPGAAEDVSADDVDPTVAADSDES